MQPTPRSRGLMVRLATLELFACKHMTPRSGSGGTEPSENRSQAVLGSDAERHTRLQSNMLKVLSRPTLRSPVLLCALSGWPDAGQAASGAIEYLIMKWAPRRFAELDSSRAYVQTNNRPRSKLTRGGQRRLIWPSFACYALPVPQAPRDLVLLLGPEPDLRWRTCSDAILDLAEELGSDLVVSLGAYLAPTSHAGPVTLTGRGTRPELRRATDGARAARWQVRGADRLLDGAARGDGPARLGIGLGLGRQPDLPPRPLQPEALGGAAGGRGEGAEGRSRPDRAGGGRPRPGAPHRRGAGAAPGPGAVCAPPGD